MADIANINQTQLIDRSNDLMNRRGITAEQKDTFRAILDKVSTQNSKSNPKDILTSLVADELALISKVHGLADTAVVGRLDAEGAYNLLQQPGSYADLNNDGFVRVGEAWTWSFPPPNAPQNVNDAWDELTAGMSEMDKMMAMAPYMAMEVSANIKYDAYGTPIGITGPDQPGYRNIYAQSGFSYQNLVDKCLSNLEAGKPYISFKDYIERKEMLDKFLDLLQKHEVK
jgi:hypothetical protein